MADFGSANYSSMEQSTSGQEDNNEQAHPYTMASDLPRYGSVGFIRSWTSSWWLGD